MHSHKLPHRSRQNCSHMPSPVGWCGCDPITTWEHAWKHNPTHLAANPAKIQCSHDKIISPTTNQCSSWMSSNKEGKTNGKLILLIFNISHFTLIPKTSICLWNIHTLIRRRCLWVGQPVKMVSVMKQWGTEWENWEQMAEKEPSVYINNRQAQGGQLNLWVPLPPGFSAFWKLTLVQKHFHHRVCRIKHPDLHIMWHNSFKLT